MRDESRHVSQPSLGQVFVPYQRAPQGEIIAVHSQTTTTDVQETQIGGWIHLMRDSDSAWAWARDVHHTGSDSKGYE